MKRPALPIASETGVHDNGASLSINKWSGQHPRTRARWNVYCGDARETLPTLSRNHYECIITSPPYFWQRDYGVLGQIGVEQNPGEYVAAICDVMDGVKEVLAPRGVLLLNLGDTYYSGKGRPQGTDRKHNGRRFSVLRAVDASGMGPPKKTLLGMPWRVALAMVDRGWILRSSIIWRRENAVPEPNVRDRPWRTYEFIYLFAKSRSYHFNRVPLRNAGEEDLWTIESQSQAGREHPAVFPPLLVERCLAIGNPDNGPVLDPFAGSGTVLQVALGQGMPADGIDLNPAFCRSIALELGS
jgi:DNA modification methylase